MLTLSRRQHHPAFAGWWPLLRRNGARPIGIEQEGREEEGRGERGERRGKREESRADFAPSLLSPLFDLRSSLTVEGSMFQRQKMEDGRWKMEEWFHRVWVNGRGRGRIGCWRSGEAAGGTELNRRKRRERRERRKREESRADFAASLLSPLSSLRSPVFSLAEMVDHALRKGVKFDKPALGVTP